MNPDQTAPFGSSDLGPYCLQYRLPKNISRQEELMIKVVTGWQRSKSKGVFRRYDLVVLT